MARFNRKGNTRIVFLTTIADPALIPTRTELDAGTDYTAQIAAIDGFTTENSPIETPDMASTFVGKIEGDDTAADSSITFYEDDVLDDIETDLAKGTVGFLVFFSKGDVPDGKGMDVFPVSVTSLSKPYTADSEAAKIVVSFAVTARPLQNGTVPAAV